MGLWRTCHLHSAGTPAVVSSRLFSGLQLKMWKPDPADYLLVLQSCEECPAELLRALSTFVVSPRAASRVRLLVRTRGCGCLLWKVCSSRDKLGLKPIAGPVGWSLIHSLRDRIVLNMGSNKTFKQISVHSLLKRVDADFFFKFFAVSCVSTRWVLKLRSKKAYTARLNALFMSGLSCHHIKYSCCVRMWMKLAAQRFEKNVFHLSFHQRSAAFTFYALIDPVGFVPWSRLASSDVCWSTRTFQSVALKNKTRIVFHVWKRSKMQTKQRNKRVDKLWRLHTVQEPHLLKSLHTKRCANQVEMCKTQCWFLKRKTLKCGSQTAMFSAEKKKIIELHRRDMCALLSP